MHIRISGNNHGLSGEANVEVPQAMITQARSATKTLDSLKTTQQQL